MPRFSDTLEERPRMRDWKEAEVILKRSPAPHWGAG